jgi:hypothetical protein
VTQKSTPAGAVLSSPLAVRLGSAKAALSAADLTCRFELTPLRAGLFGFCTMLHRFPQEK